MNPQDDKFTFRDFLSDDTFLRAAHDAREGRPEALDALLGEHPAAEAEIRKACLLLRAVRPSGPEVSADAIARSLAGVYRTARRRRVRRLAVWSAAAAVLVAVVAGSFVVRMQAQMLERQIAATLADDRFVCDSIVVGVDGRELFRLSEADVRIDRDGTGLVINEQQRIEAGRIKSGMIHVSVPYGKRSLVEMEDGTRVWIGPGTKIVYPARFGGKVRELYADGQIYLDVAHDARRPFIVLTERVELRVLGTRFNLNSSHKGARAEVVLVEGRVEVASKTGEREVLSPRQRYTEVAGIVAVDTVDTNYFTSWKDGYLRLDKYLLADVFVQIERYYGVTLECDEELGRRAYSGKLDLSEEVEEVLTNLSMVESFSFERVDTDKNTFRLTAKTP